MEEMEDVEVEEVVEGVRAIVDEEKGDGDEDWTEDNNELMGKTEFCDEELDE